MVRHCLKTKQRKTLISHTIHKICVRCSLFCLGAYGRVWLGEIVFIVVVVIVGGGGGGIVYVCNYQNKTNYDNFPGFTQTGNLPSALERLSTLVNM